MKKTLSLLLLLPIFLLSCQKRGDIEDRLSVQLEPVNISMPVKITGSSYDIKVIIKSEMPRKGIDIYVNYQKMGDQSLLFTKSLSTTNSSTDITITGVTTVGGYVEVAVVSKTDDTNWVKQSFSLSSQ